MSIKPWIKKSSITLLSTPFVSVQSDEVMLSNGTVIPDFYTVSIQNAALIVASKENDEIILIREYRYACKEAVTECPAGMVEDDEKPLDTAKRELLEETGFESHDWTYLGPTLESTSKLTNTMHMFWAKGCVKVDDQRIEETEGSIEVIVVPFKEAVDMVMDGKIKANSSAHGILKVARMIDI